MLTDTQAAFIAGIIDGEGHLSIEKHVKRWTYPSVRVCSTDRRLVDYLVNLLGGSIQTQAAGPRRRETFNWVYTGLKRIDILESQVSKYSIIKPEQWALLREFIHGREQIKEFNNQALNEAERLRKDNVRERLKTYTRRTFDV